MDEALKWLIPAIILSALFFGLQSAAVTSKGRSLAKSFGGLGDMTGMSKDKIIGTVGSPTSVSELPGGKTLLQWQETGYHIAIRFDGDTFDGITHEAGQA